MTVKGLCFKRVKLVEYGVGVDGPEPTALRVSDNGRVLVDATGRPVFLLADTAWSLARRLSREDAEKYLRQRRDQRFNAVTFVLFAPGKTELVDTMANIYGDSPFGLKDQRQDPTQPLVTPGADPAHAKSYDYGDHIDYLVRLTRRLGLHAILLPTWGSVVTFADPDTRLIMVQVLSGPNPSSWSLPASGELRLAEGDWLRGRLPRALATGIIHAGVFREPPVMS